MMHLSIEYKFTQEPTRHRLEHPLLSMLESVHQSNSIRQAAKDLGVSYRFIWGELKRWESELNTNLIVWGRTGKGATLTHEAKQFLLAVAQTHAELEPQIANIKHRVEACVSVLRNTRTEIYAAH